LPCWTPAPSAHSGRSWTSSGAAHHHRAAGRPAAHAKL
jgi:hypothetical protein